ncbi:uncharacterized protein LOC124290857 [Haliotis rubra]|uniref:uncharacterized protein LOC124290857 n=1 Tax=Haliotis rubra TaxID=36100 RepID=UPI001EE628E6|nr:uncharacterized protein LOC124290857 [Haliotis rubra]
MQLRKDTVIVKMKNLFAALLMALVLALSQATFGYDQKYGYDNRGYVGYDYPKGDSYRPSYDPYKPKYGSYRPRYDYQKPKYDNYQYPRYY